MLPRQSTFFALSQAEGGAGLGSESGDLPAGLNSAKLSMQKRSKLLISEALVSPPEKWAVLLEDLLSPPVLKFWNLIFSSL